MTIATQLSIIAALHRLRGPASLLGKRKAARLSGRPSTSRRYHCTRPYAGITQIRSWGRPDTSGPLSLASQAPPFSVVKSILDRRRCQSIRIPQIHHLNFVGAAFRELASGVGNQACGNCSDSGALDRQQSQLRLSGGSRNPAPGHIITALPVIRTAHPPPCAPGLRLSPE